MALLGIGLAGGVQVGYASLVDLKTGQIAWFNRLIRASGDMREQEPAKLSIDLLLANFPVLAGRLIVIPHPSKQGLYFQCIFLGRKHSKEFLMHRRFSQSVVLGAIVIATSMAVLAQTNSRPAPSASPSAGVDASADNPRGKFVRVMPLAPNPGTASSSGAPKPNSGGDLRIGQGKFFSFALPPGWRVGELAKTGNTLSRC